MSNNFNSIYAFLGGALVGAGVALLFAPQKGVELRAHIKEMLMKKGVCNCDAQVDKIVDEIIDNK